jgi:hypothetical protein
VLRLTHGMGKGDMPTWRNSPGRKRPMSRPSTVSSAAAREVREICRSEVGQRGAKQMMEEMREKKGSRERVRQSLLDRSGVLLGQQARRASRSSSIVTAPLLRS